MNNKEIYIFLMQLNAQKVDVRETHRGEKTYKMLDVQLGRPLTLIIDAGDLHTVICNSIEFTGIFADADFLIDGYLNRTINARRIKDIKIRPCSEENKEKKLREIKFPLY